VGEGCASGPEEHWAVNAVGAFALTMQLLDAMRRAATSKRPAVVVTVSSRAHWQGSSARVRRLAQDPQTRPPFFSLRKWLPYFRYADSKLANVLLASEFHRRFARDNIVSLSCHPGLVRTAIFRDSAFLAWMSRWYRDADDAAQEIVDLVVSQDPGGKYFSKGVKCAPSGAAQDASLARVVFDSVHRWVEQQLSSI